MIKVHSEKLINSPPEEKIKFDSIDLKEDSLQKMVKKKLDERIQT